MFNAAAVMDVGEMKAKLKKRLDKILKETQGISKDVTESMYDATGQSEDLLMAIKDIELAVHEVRKLLEK